MNLDFTSEQDMLRKSVAEFIAKESPFEVVKEIEESEQGYAPKMWKKMAELGWMEMHLPEAYGGYDDPFMDMMIIFEEMGKRAFVSPFFSTVMRCGLAIAEGGSEAQKKELLPRIGSGKLIMAMAQYEAEASYREQGIQMPAELSEGGYVLNGTKMFALDANVADKLLVAARAAEGVTLFIVDAAQDGVRITKMPTIGWDNNCEVVFQNVKVPAENVLGQAGSGWAILEKIETKAIVAKCAEMVGACRTAIEMTNAYAKERVQYGKPIGGYQAIQHYLADMKLAYDTIVNYLYKVTWMIDEGLDASREASALKLRVNRNYKFITERAIQIHGGIGTTREFDIGLFYRRAKSCEYAMGDDNYHYDKVASALNLQ